MNTDYQISDKHRLSQRFFYSRDPQEVPFSSCSPGCPPGFALNTQFTNDVGLLKLTSTLTPSFLNEGLIAFIRNTGVLQSQTKITDSSLGITPGDPGFPYLPVTVISGLFSLGGGFNDFSDSVVNTYQAADQISWSHDVTTFAPATSLSASSSILPMMARAAAKFYFLASPTFCSGKAARKMAAGTAISS